jgi:DNA topoisomerase-1
MGRFGPFVQIGTKDDEEKPKFAGLRPGQKMDSITLPAALELFRLPRTLGQTESGEPITTNVGRFGPYVKYGAKYVSLKAGDDPYEVTLERALELIKAKEEADANRIIQVFESAGIQVLNGRFGPYITDRKKNAKIPKDRDPRTLTLEECLALIAAAPERGFGRFGRFARKKTAAAEAPAAEGAAKSAAAKKAPARRAAAKSAAGTRTSAGRAAAPKKAATRKAPARKSAKE